VPPEPITDVASLETPASRRRMLVVVNPYATTVDARLRELVVHALHSRYDVTAVDTEAPGHAIELARSAALEGYDVVVAFGGDGTVNEAANGLARSDGRPAETALTCLPGGSANIYCRILGIPNDIVDATEQLLSAADGWAPRRVDLGRVNGRYFTFCSGVGLDASVVAVVDANPRRKARYRAWYFAFVGVATFLRRYSLRAPRMTVTAAGRIPVDGVTLLVQNADPFTYFRRRPIHATDGGALDDGFLSCVVLQSTRPTIMPTIMFRLLSCRARLSDHRAVAGFAGVTAVDVRSSDGRPLPLEVDGDFVGHAAAARYEVIPGALSVVV
jgi:diacylglycerol kinase family enzyme